MILSKRVNAEKLESVADMLRVIAHPDRLNIIVLLQAEPSLTLVQIVQRLDLDLERVSEYLSILKDKGVLRVEKKGRFRYFSVVHSSMNKIFKCLEVC